MRIFVTGTRGVPGVPGGIETHCEELYPRLVQLGCEVLLSRRTLYVQDQIISWKGVALKDIYAPKKKSFEAIVHTFLSILLAKKWRADVLHIHAIGPALLVPFARLLGLRVVVTNHGPDYDRQKWGLVPKQLLKLGEYLGGKFANEVIVISRPIFQIVKKRCGRDSVLIPNGVNIPNSATETNYIRSLGLSPGNYFLAVARLVPEKGLHDLVEAYIQASPDWKLVIAGGSDYEDSYSRSLRESVLEHSDIVLAGYIVGEPLRELFSFAGCFAMPSYHEGLPIALLEALSFGLPVLASDIPANLDIELDQSTYFRCGDVEELKEKLMVMCDKAEEAGARLHVIDGLRRKYNWDDIASATYDVYSAVVGK